MDCADGIRRLGFRRWYERQLIESHAWLVTGFLSLILALACVEEFSVRGPLGRLLLMTVLIVGAALLCMAALWRYKALLERAEHLAEQAVCGNCGVSGVLRVMGASTTARMDQEMDDESMKVECRKCGHLWTMGTRTRK